MCIWPHMYCLQNTERCCVLLSGCTVASLLLRPGLFDYLFQSLHRCGFRLQYEMKIQLFVMSHLCECGENWIHYIVETISANKVGNPVRPGTAESNGKQQMGMSCTSQLKWSSTSNSHNNNLIWTLWAQTLQPKQRCCLVYAGST